MSLTLTNKGRFVLIIINCKIGGFISIRYNELRDLTGDLLAEVCHDVTIEPQLTPLTGGWLSRKSSNKNDDACLDVSARGFWQRGDKAFLDYKGLQPISQVVLKARFECSTQMKKKRRESTVIIRQIEHASFTPLVFTCFGGMAWEYQMFYKRLSKILAEKKKVKYEFSNQLGKNEIIDESTAYHNFMSTMFTLTKTKNGCECCRYRYRGSLCWSRHWTLNVTIT